ncbi:hypothetical protein H2O64_02240 [Kordia sp. YSTF-M3]|uniref:Uncharacterized protein n=1 Tax=Kordia aestuariivivens TaxID=2759037 RepID=A0ABR7Q4V1_9FLAO|nr:DUF6090 family protein [Kordia aestuariivivens]MBC8753473.1 hypothetical protein [Kordia aestuariivivens]
MKENKIKKYLLYAIGEIILVVIGILIAVSINNWKNAKNKKVVEQNLYGDLIQELQNDLSDVEGNRQYNSKYLARYAKASNIILHDSLRQLTDTLGIIATELIFFSDFKNEESAYSKLATSGQLELISNKEILMRLQNMGMLYSYINRLEKNQEQYMYSVVPKISEYIQMKPFQVMKPAELYDYKFHNDIEIMIMIGKEKDGLYTQAETDLRNLIKLLKTELN